MASISEQQMRSDHATAVHPLQRNPHEKVAENLRRIRGHPAVANPPCFVEQVLRSYNDLDVAKS